MLKPIKRQSLSDAVFEQLRDQIVGGAFSAGQLLPAERQLSETFGVNRGALREALKRLEQARLVSIQHGGATRVLDFKATAGLDLLVQLLLTPGGGINWLVARSVIELRSALAPDIARLAALRDRLDAIVDAMATQPEDTRALQALAMDFWTTLVDASGNLAYRLAINTLREVYTQIDDLLTTTLADELGDLAAYRAVARAVRKHDDAQAGRRARELTERGARSLHALIEAAQALDPTPDHGGSTP
jgi:GntR family transcriptional regulator, transcriptional repressor for pyruvate dehydrogenase complex